ncbi:MFS transporter, partial [Haloferax sp. Atlit-24N]
TIIYAVYAIGVIIGLLIFGNLSDRVGRRYILIIGIILSIFSALIFLISNSLFLLFLGRVISGFSAGLFMTTATIALINLSPENKKSETSIIASLINMLALGLGPLLSGLFAQYLPYPIRLIFVVEFLMLIPAFIGVWIMVEPVLNKCGFKISIQKLSVPSEMR